MGINNTTQSTWSSRMTRGFRFIIDHRNWLLLIAIAVIWSFYAIDLATRELLLQLGYSIETKTRTLPKVFIVHAFLGVIPLVGGAILVDGYTITHSRRFHRTFGKLYVIATLTMAVLNLPLILLFGVPFLAKLGMVLLSITWFYTTVTGYYWIRYRRSINVHRNWMLRSYAITFFFVTFSIWMGVIESLTGSTDLAYIIGSYAGWIPNLLIIELILRRPKTDLIKFLRSQEFST